MYLEIHPYRASSIDSVKINTSLLIIIRREWVVHPLRPQDFPRLSKYPKGFALGKVQIWVQTQIQTWRYFG